MLTLFMLALVRSVHAKISRTLSRKLEGRSRAVSECLLALRVKALPRLRSPERTRRVRERARARECCLPSVRRPPRSRAIIFPGYECGRGTEIYIPASVYTLSMRKSLERTIRDSVTVLPLLGLRIARLLYSICIAAIRVGKLLAVTQPRDYRSRCTIRPAGVVGLSFD